MLIVIMTVATLLTVVWLFLLMRVDREDWRIAAYNKVLDNLLEIEKLQRKDIVNSEKLEQYQGIAAKVKGLFLNTNSEKKIVKLQQQNERLQKGDLRSVGVLDMPGYVLQRMFDAIGHGSIHKKLLYICMELYGRKYAANKTTQLLARMLSYPVIGIAVTLSLGALLYGSGSHSQGLLIMGIGTLIVIVLTYALYNDVTDNLNKRRTAISRQFPNVVSKLALLVTSGMIMDRAWRETAESQSTELYMEMRKTADELSNLVEPAVAYTNFLNRCNTKETTKLASAIIQNQSKGNAEIGALLKEMAREAWQERRHTAKKESEAANSKLMIPTMMLFLAILAMIMIPIVTSFSSGF